MLVTLLFAIVFPFACNVATAFNVVAPPEAKQKRQRSCLHAQTQSSVQHAGVPPVLKQLESGDSIVGYRNTDRGRHNVTVERVAMMPPVFVLRDFVTADECDAIRSAATIMKPAQTASGQHEDVTRKKSYVAWLGNAEANGLVGKLAVAMQRMMLIYAPPVGVEDMQVVRYDATGEYKLHHDGNDRILTVLYYLNGEGETWFPLAQTRDKHPPERPQTRREALDRAKRLRPGFDGVMFSASVPERTNACVPVFRGDAIAFYSYFQDGTMDWNAIHTGLPASNEKIVANHFFRQNW